MADYIVFLLGPVQVAWEVSEPPRFRSQRTMALLGYLAAEGRPVSREVLAALFWPDKDLSAGKANLRRELHNLGKILPRCWQTDRQTVQFVTGNGTLVDVYEVLRLEEAEEWAEAAELMRGDFLEGVYLDDNLEFETWLMGERERWRQRAERVLRRAIEEEEQAGDHDEALRFARRLLQMLPWHEETHRKVMRLLALDGQRSAALRQYERCRLVLQEELGVEVSAETQALYERIRDSLSFALHNIPAPTTPLIGREEELAQLHEWLADPDVRLITIAGAGGMGKTRLALGLAQDLLEQTPHAFRDGIYFVSLASLDDPARLVSEIASVLHFPLQIRDERSSRRQLLDYLQGKRLLLLLDNFEHLLDGAEFVGSVSEVAPDVQVVATSRERLRLQGEQVLPLHGLAYGPEMALPDNGQAASVRLFVSAAERARPDFELSDGDDGCLRQICHLVEGMPLALELAATWADTLSLATIAGEIEKGLSILATEIRDVPERHRSVRAVFDTSWRRLSTEEQSIFTRLSVFRGGFTREAAEAVAGTTVTVLSRLVNRSLVQYVPEADRYGIHELLRQYATSLLTPAEAEEVHRDHLHYFADLAEKVEPWRQVGEDEMALSQMEREMGNLRAALEWSLRDPTRTPQGLRLAAGLEHFWTLGGHIDEGYEWLSNLLSAPASDVDHRVRARALRTAATLTGNLTKDRPAMFVLLREALTLQKQAGDEKERVKTLCVLANAELGRRNLREAKARCREALDLAEEVNHTWGVCRALYELGFVALIDQDLESAQVHFEKALPLSKENGDLPRVGDILSGLGQIAMMQKKWSDARSYLRKALMLHRRLGNKFGIARELNTLGELARAARDYRVARRYYSESLAFRRELGAAPASVAIELFNLGQTYLMLGQSGRSIAAFKECLFLGREIDSESILELALEGLANAASAQKDPGQAITLWGAAETIRQTLGANLDFPDQLAHDHFVGIARKQIDERDFAIAWTEGRDMVLEEAVEVALDFVAQSVETTV